VNAMQKQFLPQEFSQISIVGRVGHYTIRGSPKGTPFKISAQKLSDDSVKINIEEGTLNIIEEVGLPSSEAHFDVFWPQDIRVSLL
jgi:hypothetical protein